MNHFLFQDHKSLTVTLITITLFFLISEIPSSLVSRTKAVPVLFSGDPEKGNTTALEVCRQISTLLGALNITMNFFLYCLFCPAYCRVLAKMMKRNNQHTRTVQFNLFVVNSQNQNGKTTKAKILHIEKQGSESSCSSGLYDLYKDRLLKMDLHSRRTEEAEYVEIINNDKFFESKVSDTSSQNYI